MQKEPTSRQNQDRKKDTQSDAENTGTALKQDEQDSSYDSDMAPDPAVDLDEGELARLEGQDEHSA